MNYFQEIKTQIKIENVFSYNGKTKSFPLYQDRPKDRDA